MQVQDVVNAVSTDVRQVLQSSGTDAATIMGWVDRVHKDVLHTSIYVNQNLATTQITTATGVNSYALTPTNVRRIVGAYDITFNHSLTPSDAEENEPTPVQARVEEQQGQPFITAQAPMPHQVYRFGGLPEYYRFIAPSTFVVRPAPQSVAYQSTINITYEQLVSTVNNLTTTLIVPDDGLDVMVAGVNWMAMAYIGRPQEAMSWFQLYQDLKAGNRIGVIR